MNRKRIAVYIIITLLGVIGISMVSVMYYARSMNNKTIKIFPSNRFEVNIDNQQLSGQIYDYGRQEEGYYFLVITQKKDNIVDGYYLKIINEKRNILCWEGPYSDTIKNYGKEVEVYKR